MDKNRLEYEFKRRGYTTETFTKAIGIGRSTYYKKVKGCSEFTQSEIQKIIDLLGISSPMGIFFANKVS